jgi:hypothetical protein
VEDVFDAFFLSFDLEGVSSRIRLLPLISVDSTVEAIKKYIKKKKIVEICRNKII